MKIKKIVFSFVGAALAVGAIAGALVPAKDAKSVGAVEAVEPLENGQVILRLEKDAGCTLTDEEILETVYVHNWKLGADYTTWPGNLIDTFGLVKYDETRWTFTLPVAEDGYLYDMFILHTNGGINDQTANSQWIGLDATHEYVLKINADGGVSGGEWSKIAQPYTSDMLRLWVNRGSYGGDGKHILLNVWGDEGAYKSLPTVYATMGVEGKTTISMPYFDVPKTAITGNHVQFQQITSQGVFEFAFNHNDLGEENVYVAGDNAQIYFLWSDDTGSKFSQGSFGEDGSLSATYIKPVLEGYFSCADDMDNGYANWDRVKQTWISYTDGEGAEHWIVTGELGSVTLNDFDTEADYATGDRNNVIDAWTKCHMMETLYNANLPSSLYGVDNGSFDDTAIIIASVTLLSVVSVSAIVFIGMKKRRLNK